jgi:hypothetical protein
VGVSGNRSRRLSPRSPHTLTAMAPVVDRWTAGSGRFSSPSPFVTVFSTILVSDSIIASNLLNRSSPPSSSRGTGTGTSFMTSSRIVQKCRLHSAPAWTWWLASDTKPGILAHVEEEVGSSSFPPRHSSRVGNSVGEAVVAAANGRVLCIGTKVGNRRQASAVVSPIFAAGQLIPLAIV